MVTIGVNRSKKKYNSPKCTPYSLSVRGLARCNLEGGGVI